MRRRPGIKLFDFYLDSFRGLSRQMWWLSLATLVNRAGTMVIPFLSIYMSKNLEFSLSQIGWVMTFFGLGSLLGSWLGGKLTDRFSYYHVMITSMMLSGFGFMILIYFKSYLGVCIAIFVQMTISDAFRPAAFTAIDAYSLPENKTRSISLIRLFINLGYSIGPAIGGFIFYRYGASLLFYLDGITCILSAVFILIALRPKPHSLEAEKQNNLYAKASSTGVWKDKAYLLMMLILFLFNIAFFQLFANLPLFYKEIHHLNEKTIGWIMALNGILIFLTEMPLVSWMERRKFSALKIIFVSTIFLSISYFLLNTTMWFWMLIISMIFLTLSEMLGFPYSNSWSLERAPKGRVGEYMGAYTIAFSLSHIIGPNLGLQVSSNFGYATSWYLMGVIGIISAVLTLVLIKMVGSSRA
ncbi:MDR family MFS transporter [Portibacter marinus]|uniref:MDR family MFS transporter n=1 Tax=Portibacter marinus TaxID=2898660 RepID=UPI001F2A2603|nr:MFS transporter [Portibacter marinus]